MPDESNGSSGAPWLNDIGQTVSSIFKQRLWEKQDLDFKAGPVKQFEKRIMAVGMLAAQSTVDDSPDAPADVPKEIILAAADLRMAAAMQYPNNPLVSKTAAALHGNALQSISELFGAREKEADIKGTEATSRFNNAQGDYKEKYNKAGGAEEDVKLVTSQRKLNDRMPAERGDGGGKTPLFLGLPPGAIQNVDDLYAAMVRYEETPPDQGGTSQDAMKFGFDRARGQIASERSGHLVQPENTMKGTPAVTLESLSDNVPPEDAMKRARYERGLQYAQITGGPPMVEEWKKRYGHLLGPGMTSPVSGSPGTTMPESGIVALTIGQGKIKQIESAAGMTAPIGTVKEAMAALPASYTELLNGDGPLPATLSYVMDELESKPGLVAEIAKLPKDQQRQTLIDFMNTRGEVLVDDLLKIPRGVDPSKIPDTVRVSKRQAMNLTSAAANKYVDQMLVQLGLVSLIEAPKKKKFGKGILDSIDKFTDKTAVGKLINNASEFTFGKDFE